MFYNYIIIALRNLKKYKGFTFINITGLAVGITCFLLLSLFVLDELGYDKFNKNVKNIYRIIVHSQIAGGESTNSKSAAIAGETLLRDLPEVLSYARIGYFGSHVLRYQDKVFREYLIYSADSTYFSIFTLPFIYGDPKTALVKPNSMVMTETMAKKYFNDANPVGQTIQVNGNSTFLITGVMKDFPEKSHFYCNAFMSSATFPATESKYWLNSWFTTYIVLQEGTDPRVIDQKMKKTVIDYVGPQAQAILGVPIEEFLAAGNSYEFFLQPLSSIYLYSQRDYHVDLNTEWGTIRTGDITNIYFFSAIAFFILLIAVINFINLATARSESRAKEVGIRKTVGSTKLSLVIQFLVESILMCVFAVMIALVLLELVLPQFNALAGKDLKLEFLSYPGTIPILVLFTIIVGILAGSYPAFYLSSFQPSHILKANSGRGSKKSTLRSVLVIIQFAISITLIVGTIVIKKQVNYVQNKDLGFNKESLLCINNAGILGSRVKEFKEQLASNPAIISITNASRMFESGIPGNGYLYNKRTGVDPVSFQFLDVDYDFLKTFQIEMKDGRFFSEDFAMDTNAVVINEAAVRECKDVDPIGKELTPISEHQAKSYTIIGVVKDFNYESLHKKVRPLLLYLNSPRQYANLLDIRIQSHNLPGTIKFIEDTWAAFMQEEKCNYSFVDQNIAYLYSAEEKIGTITTVFSLLAIFIACLGLFGLTAFVAEKRTKEIGIRKILGASPVGLTVMLAADFTKWIVLANIIAWPAAWFVLHKWLQNFAYRIPISWWMFVLAAFIVLIIALLTVGYQTMNAATANPVDSLHYE